MPERPELDVVRRFYAEAINGRDSSACERLLGEEFVHNGERRAVLRVDDGLIVEAWDKVDLPLRPDRDVAGGRLARLAMQPTERVRTPAGDDLTGCSA